jgi:hypothetical protein
MQATPGGSTVEIAHAVFTGGLLTPTCFGFAVAFSSMTIVIANSFLCVVLHSTANTCDV